MDMGQVGIIHIHFITTGVTIPSIVTGTIGVLTPDMDTMSHGDMEILTVTTVVTMEIIMELETVGIALLT